MAFMAALLALPVTAQPAQQSLRLLALDVGEGQAILLQRGDRGVLVDTGHAGAAAKVLERVEALGVTRLDYLILTHLHPDHASGYFRLREAFPEAVVLDHGDHPRSLQVPDTQRWLAEALAADGQRQQLRAPMRLQWQGVTLNVLWPFSPAGDDLNADSLVLEVVHEEGRALLMGDVGQAVEEYLLAQSVLHGPYDVLVAGHHGSKNTASEPFLGVVSPRYTLISTNADNLRGYPDAQTVRRLRAHTRETVLTTFDRGEVCLEWRPGAQAVGRCAE